MTNLEFYKDELINIIIGNMGIGKDGKPYSCSECCGDDCIFQREFNCHQMAKEWLFKEHKEPIKLKQWEYDLIRYYFDVVGVSDFVYSKALFVMKEKEYFKGVTDISMNLQEILDNCIIVADDYDFGGNEND